MTNKWKIRDQTNDQNLHINNQITIFVANFRSLITKYMTRLMTKYATKLMTSRQAINDQTIYHHISGRVIRDQKLATKTDIWSFICECWLFFWSLISNLLVTYLSLFVTNLVFLVILYMNIHSFL